MIAISPEQRLNLTEEIKGTLALRFMLCNERGL
jgi:hypothetical protein